MIQRIKELIEIAKSWDSKTLEAYRIVIFFAVVVDLIGVWWFLGLKKLGGALMVVLLMCLAIILILERRLPRELVNKKPKTPKKPKKRKMMDIFEQEQAEDKEEESEEEEKKPESGFGIDLGLGSTQDYNKRLESAIGGI